MTPDRSTTDEGLVLTGLDGSNPLAFLAALGTLRSMSSSWPDQIIRLSWQRHAYWRPQLHFRQPPTAKEMVSALAGQLAGAHSRPELNVLGDDLTIEPPAFRKFAQEVVRTACNNDRSTADFLVAFGSDVTIANDGTIQDTCFRTMAGAGHQHFLAFMRNIANATSPQHLHKALFESWRYDDPVQKSTLRWDPMDDVRYGLRWRNPSGDPVRRYSGSMLGANRLAIEGLPLFPTAPGGDKLRTTGFKGGKANNTFWTWPIWEYPAPLDVVRSLVAFPELQGEYPDRSALMGIGIAEVFRSQRITTGKVRNFTLGTPV